MRATITDFTKAVHEDRFIDAHEILEQSWKDLKQSGRTEEARLQKGLINGTTAIGLHHEKGRTDAAKRVWQTFEKYRPLIRTVTSEYTPLYQEAEVLLDRKRALFGPEI